MDLLGIFISHTRQVARTYFSGTWSRWKGFCLSWQVPGIELTLHTQTHVGVYKKDFRSKGKLSRSPFLQLECYCKTNQPTLFNQKLIMQWVNLAIDWEMKEAAEVCQNKGFYCNSENCTIYHISKHQNKNIKQLLSFIFQFFLGIKTRAQRRARVQASKILWKIDGNRLE